MTKTILEEEKMTDLLDIDFKTTFLKLLKELKEDIDSQENDIWTK